MYIRGKFGFEGVQGRTLVPLQRSKAKATWFSGFICGDRSGFLERVWMGRNWHMLLRYYNLVSLQVGNMPQI